MKDPKSNIVKREGYGKLYKYIENKDKNIFKVLVYKGEWKDDVPHS